MTIQNWRFSSDVAWVVFLLCTWIIMLPISLAATGTWVPLVHQAPDTVGSMLLLSDGSVMCLDTPDDHTPNSKVWYRLIPDKYGSYTNGTWTNDIQAMNYAHGLCASAVLPDGRVFVAGGEYPAAAQTTNAEIYDPVGNSWSMITPPISLFNPNTNSDAKPWDQILSDMISMVTANGDVLMAPVNARNYGGTLLYNPKSGVWFDGPVLTNNAYSQSECSWAMLPDGSIITIDSPDQNANQGINIGRLSERYIPSLNRWIPDATVPVFVWNLNGGGSEIGPALTLPNGSVLWVSGTGTNVIYTPSGNTSPGSWSVGPISPNNLQADDVGGAMMVNGKALLILSANCGNGGCDTPWYFYEYDYTLGSSNSSLTLAPDPTAGIDTVPYVVPFMLDLPDGTVLLSSGTSQLNVYQPNGSPLAAWKPTITSITANADGSFHLMGTQLNGISEGAAEGDDGQMATDYPLVRMTNNSSGLVYYARTYDWSSTRIQTGSTPETTEFTLPAGVFAGGGTNYSLVVVANGIASDPFTFYGPVWVDFNYTGTLQLGTFSNPYPTLAQGISAVPSGGTIFVKPGSSTETPTITKPMTIVAVGGAAMVGK